MTKNTPILRLLKPRWTCTLRDEISKIKIVLLGQTFIHINIVLYSGCRKKKILEICLIQDMTSYINFFNNSKLFQPVQNTLKQCEYI